MTDTHDPGPLPEGEQSPYAAKLPVIRMRHRSGYKYGGPHSGYEITLDERDISRQVRRVRIDVDGASRLAEVTVTYVTEGLDVQLPAVVHLRAVEGEGLP